MTVNHYGTSATPRPVRSAYWRQVEQIAPLQLLGREPELAELAGFCTQEQRGRYVWWRAGPWAGKSALLSTFVLDPPEVLAAGRVRLVSFFITARLAAQDTREAFATALTDQLCALLGLDPLVDGGEAALRDLLDQAATACRQEGGRLVLVVDGLDEDRGVTTGPGARSIAALLPGRPPAGMRVIVAGRPNPPIPDDVPDWHPLRDPGIIRLLGDSSHARDLQRLGQSELKRLLKGSQVERDLLGLLTAARGGLSGPDLRELTGADLVAVEEILHTVAGRTFTRRLARWAPDDGPQVYLLGHEELHNAASHYLGPRLLDHRDRLHAWAEGYCTPADGRPPWPAHTPEYLLTGYPRMLATSGDSDRLTTLATDPARHDRMLNLTGGDTAAFTEIKTCQDLLLNCPQPDLYALARLSHHRGQLESRNVNIPAHLPAVWATLGQPNRAEALARSLTDPGRQAEALTRLARAVSGAGDHERARELAAEAEQIARTVTNPGRQAQALTRLARAVSGAGDHERARELAAGAEQIARTLTDPAQLAQTLAEVAGTVSVVGDHERARELAADAEQIARTITDPAQQAWALTTLTRAVAGAGDHERARELAAEAVQIARTITNPDQQAETLAEVAGAVARVGDHEHAEQIARTITDPFQQAKALATLAGALTEAGDHEGAEQIACTITDPYWQAQTLAEVAGAVAGAGDHERARELAADAEQIARTITDPAQLAQTLAEVVRAVSVVGDHERTRELAAGAEQIARTITDPAKQAWLLAEVATTVAEAGDHEHAEQIARTITNPAWRAQTLAGIAEAVSVVGDHERARELAAGAEQIARTLTDPEQQAWLLAEVATTVAEAGDHERARELAAEAVQIARTITNPYRQAEELAGVARAVARAGDHERAVQIARTITNPYQQAQAFTEVAMVVAKGGDLVHAEQITHSRDPDQRARALAAVSGAVARAGDHERAEQIARTITNPYLQAQALTRLAGIVGLPRAGRLLGEAFALGSWLTPLPVLAKILPHELIRIVDAVYADKPLHHAR